MEWDAYQMFVMEGGQAFEYWSRFITKQLIGLRKELE